MPRAENDIINPKYSVLDRVHLDQSENDLANNLDHNSKENFANLRKYSQIFNLDHELDSGDDTKLLLPKTISDIDISH